MVAAAAGRPAGSRHLLSRRRRAAAAWLARSSSSSASRARAIVRRSRIRQQLPPPPPSLAPLSRTIGGLKRLSSSSFQYRLKCQCMTTTAKAKARATRLLFALLSADRRFRTVDRRVAGPPQQVSVVTKYIRCRSSLDLRYTRRALTLFVCASVAVECAHAACSSGQQRGKAG